MVSLESVSIPALFFFVIINPFISWWQSYYVLCTIDPLYNQSKATNTGGRYTLQSEFLGVVAFGFCLILLNGVTSVCTTMLLFRWKYMPSIPRIIRFCLILPIMIALGILVTFGPFVSPFISADLAWRSKYRHTCDGMDIRVYLDSAETRRSPLVKFFNLTSGEKYTMAMTPDPEVWGLDSKATYNFSLVKGSEEAREGSSGFIPNWDHVIFDLSEKKFNVLDANKNSVKSGEFTLGKDFKIPVFAVAGNLEAFARRCVFDPTAEIYDLQIDYNGQRVLKSMMMKTAQFKICDLLQVCTGDWFGNMTAVPVGLLLLQRAGTPSGCCRGKVIPGMAGRDKGVDGNG